MNIETERLLIRPFTMDDVFDMHDLFVLPEVMQPVGMAPAFTKIEESRERISRWIKKGIHHAYMTETVNAVIESLRADGIHFVWACCFQDNLVSKNLIERCGFVLHKNKLHLYLREHRRLLLYITTYPDRNCF